MSIDVLHEKIRKTKCPLMMDLSIQQEFLPLHLMADEGDYAKAYFRFCRELLEVMADKVSAVRFNFDEFALLNDGLSNLKDLLKMAKAKGFYVLMDGPQILTPWSAQRAASVIWGNDEYPCDGLLISPYIGGDALRPFLPITISFGWKSSIQLGFLPSLAFLHPRREGSVRYCPLSQ